MSLTGQVSSSTISSRGTSQLLYIPVYKEDIKSDPNNNRPVSILPVVSKIIEKVIFKQLYEYLTDNNLLTVSQHGFRPMHSTLTALLEVSNNWYCLLYTSPSPRDA